MSPRQYKPKGYPGGKVPEAHIAWVNTYVGKWTLQEHPEQTADYGESGCNHSLILHFATGGYRTFDLTALRVEELEAIREFLEYTYQKIKPILELRDEEARVAQDEGDGSYRRNYRAIPQLVVRERTPRDHSAGVRERPVPSPEGISEGPDRSISPRDGGNAVAEREPEVMGSEDHPSTTD